MEAVHGFHVFWDVQPAVCKVVEWFDRENMTPEGVETTRFDESIISEEHPWEDELKCNLCIHVEDNAHKVMILFLSDELFLCEFIVLVVLIHEDVMKREDEVRG